MVLDTYDLAPFCGRGFKFENWGTWRNYLEKCSRIIAILLYSNEIQICWEFFSKIHHMALGIVKKHTKKETLSLIWGDLHHQILHFMNSNLHAWGKIWWHDINLLWKMSKLTFLCFFTNKLFFWTKAKVFKEKVVSVFWFDAF